MDTREEITTEATACRTLFEKKTRDYGTSWRIMRLPSLTDQIYIKANRIRSIQESGENRVGDDIRDEFVAMVNYAVMALIQQELTADTADTELPLDEALKLYDHHLGRTLALMMDKNHDYDEAWRQMRISSLDDIILMKLFRIKSIEDHQGNTIVSEGLDANYYDIINYAMFALIRLVVEGEK
jgi:Domain of Unknown Function (DUF1599).